MARLQLELVLKRKWFFTPALVALVLLGRLGLLRDRPNAEYRDGIEPGTARAARWLVDRAMQVEVRSG